ncbi:MAG TPA: DUF1552 domain-containing protein [Polyangiaceae bacterium]|nr:DUF1552 domain-containing protein [Polyangiaceae bacterium]
MKRRIDRRLFLRAATGAAVALPLLPSLRAQGQSSAPIRRFVTFYTPNGQIHSAWWPTASTSQTDFTLNDIHQPLAGHLSRLTLLKNVDLQTAGGGPGGPHQRGIGTLFTGQYLQDGDFVDGCGSTAGWADGVSVDQVIAAQIGQSTPYPSLELGVRATDNDVQGRIAYSGPGAPLPPLVQPLDVYNRVFKDLVVPDQSGNMPADPMIAQRKSVLDAVSSQISELETRVSSDDKQKLDAHLTLVRDVERRLAQSAVSCSKPPVPATMDPTSVTDMPNIATLEIDLLSIAFACDLVRVASFAVSTGFNRIQYPWLNSMGEGHPLSHEDPSDPDAHSQLVARAQWHAGLIARLYDNLASVNEGDSTVADNTLLMWSTEVSEGNVHSHTNMPIVLMGGGWYFQTGRYIDCVENGTNPSHSNLLVTLMNAMGVEQTTFGRPEFCTGPLKALA